MDDVTRGEFDLLKQIVASNQARLEGIDQGGTKGVAVVQTQLVDVVKDITELKAESGARFDLVDRRFDAVGKRFDDHMQIHEQDKRDRIIGRRWLVGIGIAGMGSMAAVLGLLVDVIQHLHG